MARFHSSHQTPIKNPPGAYDDNMNERGAAALLVSKQHSDDDEKAGRRIVVRKDGPWGLGGFYTLMRSL